MAGDRLRCCVPFCNRTRGDRKGDPVGQYSEWICGDHWKLVSRRTKLFRRRCDTAAEKARAADERYMATHPGYASLDLWAARQKAIRRAIRAWERCKREAIERAVGIST